MTRLIYSSRAAWLVLTACLAIPGASAAAPGTGDAGGSSTLVPDTMIDVGGTRLHVAVAALSSAPTVVFQAGGAADAGAWHGIPDRLAQRGIASVLAYDRAGLGASDLGPEDLSPAGEVEQLRRLLDALEAPRPYVLVGHSYGGLLIQLHAALHPDEVAGLILLDPMNVHFVDAMGMNWVQGTVPDVEEPETSREFVIARMKHTFEPLIERLRRTEAPVDIPITVLTAGTGWWADDEADRAWRESHRRLVAGRSNARLVVAGSSRHAIPETDPELVLRAIAETVAGLDP